MKIRRFQEGGPAPAPAAQAAQPGPEEQIAQMAQQIIQEIGPEASAMLAQMIMQLLEGAGPAQAPAEQPMYQRQGGKLIKKK
jgi:hypothetical protein